MATHAFINVAWDGPEQHVRVDCIEALIEHADNIGVDVVLSSGHVVSAPGQLRSKIVEQMNNALSALADLEDAELATRLHFEPGMACFHRDFMDATILGDPSNKVRVCTVCGESFAIPADDGA